MFIISLRKLINTVLQKYQRSFHLDKSRFIVIIINTFQQNLCFLLQKIKSKTFVYLCRSSSVNHSWTQIELYLICIGCWLCAYRSSTFLLIALFNSLGSACMKVYRTHLKHWAKWIESRSCSSDLCEYICVYSHRVLEKKNDYMAVRRWLHIDVYIYSFCKRLNIKYNAKVRNSGNKLAAVKK